MFDVESRIFTKVRTAVKGVNANANVVSDAIPITEKYPCVACWQMDNRNVTTTRDSSSRENHNEVSFQIDIYTDTSTAKVDAKSIASAIDTALSGIGMTRIMCQPTPNIDRTIYRITMRYSGMFDANYVLYGKS